MTKEQFIEQIAKYVQKYASKYGIKVHSPIIAQACLESAYGTSAKAKYHNYFGLKYRENRISCASGYFTDGGSEQNPDGSYTPLSNGTKWFKFDNMEKGVEGYFQFINSSNYSNLKGVTSPKKYLENIKADGYATSIAYVDNVMKVINNWNLTKYDNNSNQKEDKNMGAKLFVIAGHGAGDPGACANGYQEAERVRALAQKIKAYGGSNVTLGDVNRNYYADGGISSLNIPTTTQIIELHMDSGVASAKGGHVIIKAGYNPDQYDNALASFIKSILPGRASTIVGRSDLANPNRAASKGYPYRLVEFGFISNANDLKIFNTKIDDIAKGVLKSFGISVSGNGYTTNSTPSPAPSTNTTKPTPTAPTKSGLTAGAAYKLSNISLYTASTGNATKKISGVYYVWSTESVNGRVRITNAANRVGVAGQVTGWVDVSSLTTKANSSSASSKTFGAGVSCNLNNVTFYASSSASSGSKKSGTFYVWSTEVINGRCRMTNAANRVGVAGQVTGWVKVSDLGFNVPDSKQTSAPAKKSLTKGLAVKLSNAKLYAASTGSAVGTKSGTFYIWDAGIVNNRIRITNAANRVGVAGQVTGWVDVSACKY